MLVLPETQLLQITGLKGWRYSENEELYKYRKGGEKSYEHMSDSRQIRKREENIYPYNNYLSPKIRIACCEMNVF